MAFHKLWDVENSVCGNSEGRHSNQTFQLESPANLGISKSLMYPLGEFHPKQTKAACLCKIGFTFHHGLYVYSQLQPRTQALGGRYGTNASLAGQTLPGPG